MHGVDASAQEVARRIRSQHQGKRTPQRILANRTGVHQSQVSRILNGNFRRVSKNVMQICKFYGVDTRPTVPRNPRLQTLFAELWDGTHRREKALRKLLDALAELAMPNSRR